MPTLIAKHIVAEILGNIVEAKKSEESHSTPTPKTKAVYYYLLLKYFI